MRQLYYSLGRIRDPRASSLEFSNPGRWFSGDCWVGASSPALCHFLWSCTSPLLSGLFSCFVDSFKVLHYTISYNIAFVKCRCCSRSSLELHLSRQQNSTKEIVFILLHECFQNKTLAIIPVFCGVRDS